jgi:hypothetical protein
MVTSQVAWARFCAHAELKQMALRVAHAGQTSARHPSAKGQGYQLLSGFYQIWLNSYQGVWYYLWNRVELRFI